MNQSIKTVIFLLIVATIIGLLAGALFPIFKIDTKIVNVEVVLQDGRTDILHNYKMDTYVVHENDRFFLKNGNLYFNHEQIACGVYKFIVH